MTSSHSTGQLSSGRDYPQGAQTLNQLATDSETCDSREGTISTLEKGQSVLIGGTCTTKVDGLPTANDCKESASSGLAKSVQDKLTISSTLANTQSTESPVVSHAQSSESSPRAVKPSACLLQSDETKTVTASSSLSKGNPSSSPDIDVHVSKEDARAQSTKFPSKEVSEVSSQPVHKDSSIWSNETKISSSHEVSHAACGDSVGVSVVMGSAGDSERMGGFKEALAVAPSASGSNGGSKRRGSFKEDASWREELRTPSIELASAPLTLPNIPPPFIKLLKTVSRVVYFCNVYIAYVYLCCVCATRYLLIQQMGSHSTKSSMASRVSFPWQPW